MDTISSSLLKSSLKSPGPWLSVYMPTERTGPVSPKNGLSYKNLLRSADDRLRHWNASPLGAQAALLCDDDQFWSQPSDAVVAFGNASSFRAFRLPTTFEPRTYVGSRPHITPLLPFLQGTGSYYLLAVSENHVRLFHGASYDLKQIDLATLPQNLDAVLREHTEGQTLVHTGQPSLRGKESRVFYGEGGVDVQKTNLQNYFREIDRAVTAYLQQHGTTEPLVFCGVAYLFPIFRSVASYAHLHSEPITGNFDLAKLTELAAKANCLLTPYWARECESDCEQLRDYIGSPRVSADIESILPAACDGKVAVLLIDDSAHLDGHYDASARRCILNDSHHNEDLLNLAAVETLAHGGRVHVIKANELPAGVIVSALYRYS